MNDSTNRSNNDDNDDKKVKMFEPHNVGKQLTDACSKVLEEILIAITKRDNGGRIVELIGGDNYKRQKWRTRTTSTRITERGPM